MARGGCSVRTRFALALLLVAAAPSFALAQETVSDEWFSLQVDGKKAGHGHATRVKRKEGDRTVVESRMSLRVTIVREDSRVEMKEDELNLETEEGAPLRFEKR